MAKTPRITLSLSLDDQDRLNKVVESLDLTSSGQLLRMLLSGDPDRIDWIAKAFKNIYTLF